MQALSWSSIFFYCLFSIFVFYQQLHIKNYQSANRFFASLLNISALVGMLTGVAYLFYYGWAVTWWAPIVILIIGLIVLSLSFMIYRLLGALSLSLAGFIGWPLSAYYMFQYIPAAT